jgi:hypothetical protein
MEWNEWKKLLKAPKSLKRWSGRRVRTRDIQLGKIDFDELSIDLVLASGPISNEKR